MKSVLAFLLLIASLTVMVGCQNNQLAQVHVKQIWELGKPIEHKFVGYTKGVYIQRYKQYVFFDKGIYHCRSTTLVLQGFSGKLTTGETQGNWLGGDSGVPRLEQADGTYRRIDEIHPVAEEGQTFGPPAAPLRQTYSVALRVPLPRPDLQPDIEAIEQPRLETDIQPAPQMPGPLPIDPFRLDDPA